MTPPPQPSTSIATLMPPACPCPALTSTLSLLTRLCPPFLGPPSLSTPPAHPAHHLSAFPLPISHPWSSLRVALVTSLLYLSSFLPFPGTTLRKRISEEEEEEEEKEDEKHFFSLACVSIFAFTACHPWSPNWLIPQLRAPSLTMSISPPSSRRFPGPQAPPHTLRSITGTELISTTTPPSPGSPNSPDKRYFRHKIALFRAASGEECTLPPLLPAPSSDLDDLDVDSTADQPHCKPRISSVTDVSHPSPDNSHNQIEPLELRRSLPDVDVVPIACIPEDDDDGASTYSHASAINLDDLDDDEIAGLRMHSSSDPHAKSVLNRQMLEIRRQSFVNSFAKARQAKTRREVVVARPELQPHNKSLTLMERCVRALTEVLDMNQLYAKSATERFVAFSVLYTSDERQVIAELLRQAGMRLRSEAPTPWRTPMSTHKRSMLRATNSSNSSANQLSTVFRSPWIRVAPKVVTSDTLVRSVVFGTHVIPGAQSAESILLRLAGEFQRDEVTRKATRSERVDIPLSFSMTLTAALATFARLECATSYRRYRCRSATNRRSNPHALIWLKTRYDGLRLSFAVTLHGESPCTVLFRRPRIFSLRKIEDYATLVTEAKDIMAEFGREVVGPKD